MNKSDAINELAAALAKAQGELVGARKDSDNPFFSSKYADLASCWDALRVPLAKNGLAVTQLVQPGANAQCKLITMLIHSSGQWVSSEIEMAPSKPGPQALGSCITYMRRYSLAAITGLAQIDDDAEAATDHEGTIKPIEEWLEALDAAAKEGKTRFREVWKRLTPEYRKEINAKYSKAVERWKHTCETADTATVS